MSTAAATSSNSIASYLRGFSVLRDTRREFWAFQALRFFEHAAQYALSAILVVYISSDFGLSDERAGYALSAYGVIVSACLWFSGPLTDWLGIRRSMLVAFGGLAIMRGLLATMGFVTSFGNRGQVAIAALFAMAPFMAMMVTLTQSAVRRYTTDASRSAGFNLTYVVMNVGYLFGGLTIDLFRRVLEWHSSAIPLFGVCTAFLCLVSTPLLLSRAQPVEGAAPEGKSRERSRLALIRAAVLEPALYRLLLLVVLLLGVRSIYTYQLSIMPKYWQRVIGPDAWIGSLQAFGPLVSAVGLLLLIPVLRRFRLFDMLIGGALIASLSLFVLAIPVYGQGAYVVACAALLVLTIGEMMWAPRLNEYAASIAPRGFEGTFLGLSLMPTFIAKTIVNAYSGHMLATWIPASAPGGPTLRDRLAGGEVPFIWSPSMLWIILATVALIGPLIALLMRGFFNKDAHFEEDANAH